jgi:hypothetical protein
MGHRLFDVLRVDKDLTDHQPLATLKKSGIGDQIGLRWLA